MSDQIVNQIITPVGGIIATQIMKRRHRHDADRGEHRIR